MQGGLGEAAKSVGCASRAVCPGLETGTDRVGRRVSAPTAQIWPKTGFCAVQTVYTLEQETDRLGRRIGLPASVPGWKGCARCHLNAPPRSPADVPLGRQWRPGSWRWPDGTKASGVKVSLVVLRLIAKLTAEATRGPRASSRW